MTPDKIFELIKSVKYNTSGLSVEWKIIIDEVDGVIRLLFQESESKEDWKINFDFPVKVYKRQKTFFLVHGGYKKAWKSCNDEIIKALIDAKLRFPLYKVQVVGWSYGGAMALLAAEDYKFRSGIPVTEIMTFGAPKPLWGILTWRHFKKSALKINQYSLTYDLVSWLPPLYLRLNTKIVDKKNSWKLWRVFNVEKYHCSYGNEEYYK